MMLNLKKRELGWILNTNRIMLVPVRTIVLVCLGVMVEHKTAVSWKVDTVALTNLKHQPTHSSWHSAYPHEPFIYTFWFQIIRYTDMLISYDEMNKIFVGFNQLILEESRRVSYHILVMLLCDVDMDIKDTLTLFWKDNQPVCPSAPQPHERTWPSEVRNKLWSRPQAI